MTAIAVCAHRIPSGMHCSECARIAELVADVSAAQAVTPAGVDATLAQRGTRYGKFKDHATISQTLKFAVQNHMGDRWHDLKADQREALEMICHKIGRIANGDPDYADSWHDIAGYSTLVEKRLNGEAV